MPKTNRNPRKRATWAPEALEAAMSAVRRGKGKRQSAREFGIPYSTLKDRLKINNSAVLPLGRNSTFSAEQESELEKRCIYLAKMFYGLTPIDLRKIVYDFAEKNNMKHSFNHDKKMAGRDWLKLFLRRHPTLSLRKPEPTSLGRISGFNADSVNLFFRNLEEVMTKYGFPPARIYNVDETGITTVQAPSKIISPKGVKQLGKAVSWERGRNITVCCSISASGIYIPPMFIYPRIRKSDMLMKDGPVGAIYECSAKGWMNEELFLIWMKHFKQHSAASKESPVLLLLDNHSSHCSLATYEFCRENGITMLSFPPHTSHRLQPLDLTVFGPLKSAYSTECSIFMRQKTHIKITPYDVAGIFNRAFIRIATMEKAQKGFEVSGIVPFRPNIFTEEDFLPATISKVPTVEAFDPMHTFEEDPQPSTSKQTFSSQEPEAQVSFEEITPLRAVENTKLKRKPRKLGLSKVLTATPEKTELEQKEKRKVQKKDKGKVARSKKSFKKKVKFDDSSSASDLMNENELCDDRSSDNPEDTGMDDEICLVCGEFGKTEIWYRCGVCRKWAHKECTGCYNYKTYICDFCT